MGTKCALSPEDSRENQEIEIILDKQVNKCLIVMKSLEH